ncbi:hypothetical protein V9K92_12235 [Phyllobacterium sp. CCNWLW109]|uniref:hypothetical protein n=1 Tax=Phyllobacterium sp. CCNWLW109 TaxID=3127479 RepID=UPI003076C602
MSKAKALKAAAIVQDAGGHIVGRTRLQKIAYILVASGLEEEFAFSYKHYGPYSEDLAQLTSDASLLGFIKETEKTASWGGVYSVFDIANFAEGNPSVEREPLAKLAAAADAIELELAATALYLAKEGIGDPWAETERRKPEKSTGGRLERAKDLYHKLSDLPKPTAWPQIA